MAEAKWRLNIIAPVVLQHAPDSPERREAMQLALAGHYFTPDGSPFRVSETTLRRWIKAYDDDLAGLRPKARSDKGSRKVIIQTPPSGRSRSISKRGKESQPSCGCISAAITRPASRRS